MRTLSGQIALEFADERERAAGLFASRLRLSVRVGRVEGERCDLFVENVAVFLSRKPMHPRLRARRRVAAGQADEQ